MAVRKQTFVDRRPPDLLTAEYEDCGLFKSDLLSLNVHLTPAITRNSRQDIVVRSFLENGQPFEAVFAGRRAVMAAPLMASLDAMKVSAVANARKAGQTLSDLDHLRVPVRIDGSWRRRFWTDPSGWQTKVHQFVAARWSVQGKSKTINTFGAPPTNVH